LITSEKDQHGQQSGNCVGLAPLEYPRCPPHQHVAQQAEITPAMTSAFDKVQSLSHYEWESMVGQI
jgi:hypothetical protein